MGVRSVHCEYCKTENLAAQCQECGRSFILTSGHVKGRKRAFGDEPLERLPPDFEVPKRCDYCRARSAGEMISSVSVGMRQRSCPVCHTPCLDSP